jgi:hypothetical protein
MGVARASTKTACSPGETWRLTGAHIRIAAGDLAVGNDCLAMYDVIIKTSAKESRSQQGPEVSRWSVENKFHALNLARKIVTEDKVAWAEVTEVNGRFRAQVDVEPDGTLAGHLTSERRTHRVKHWGRPRWTRRLAKVALFLFLSGLLVFGIGQAPPGDHLLSGMGGLMVFGAITCAAVSIKARRH